MLNTKVIINVLGLLAGINGLFMLTCIPISFWYSDGEILTFLISAAVCFVLTAVLMFATRDHDKNLRKRDGYLIVTSGWLMLAATGSLPFMLSGYFGSYTDAFFETISGYTTTGATILTDIELLPQSILFWRSITHWIGGMGIIVLTIAILPLLGIGGMQLFVAESPGVSADKLHPRIKETAKRLWAIYVMLTGLECILLYFGGMDLFDAANHAMSTLSTGGFSTKNASVAHYDSSFIQWVIIIFMFVAGVNFTMTYFALKGNWKKLRNNEELKYYGLLALIIGSFVSISVYVLHPTNFEHALRDGFFQVLAILTTTGFATADYTSWTPFITVIFFGLMFTGASAGSTSGGVKMVRHLILLKNSVMELKRIIHPSAVIPVKLNHKSVTEDIVFNVLSFFLIYLVIFVTGALFMAALGLDFETSIGASIACLGNIGPGIGGVGPVDNYAFIPDIGKWFLSLLMLLGRLELFTVLILLTPFFWRKN